MYGCDIWSGGGGGGGGIFEEGPIHSVTGEPFLFHFKLTGVTSDHFSQLLEVSIVALYAVFSLDKHW